MIQDFAPKKRKFKKIPAKDYEELQLKEEENLRVEEELWELQKKMIMKMMRRGYDSDDEELEPVRKKQKTGNKWWWGRALKKEGFLSIWTNVSSFKLINIY